MTGAGLVVKKLAGVFDIVPLMVLPRLKPTK